MAIKLLPFIAASRRGTPGRNLRGTADTVAGAFKLLPLLCAIREEEHLDAIAILHEATEVATYVAPLINCKGRHSSALLCGIREEEHLAKTL